MAAPVRFDEEPETDVSPATTPATPSSDVWSFDAAKAEFTPTTTEVRISFNSALVLEIERVEASIAEADVGQRATLIRRVAELDDQLRASERAFVLRAISDAQWSELVLKHPPTDAQRARRYEWNPDTFEPAVVPLVCVMPELTADDVRWMREHLAPAQWRRLWRSVLAVCVGGDGVGFSLQPSTRTLVSALNWSTAESAASPGASSSGES